MAPKDYPAVWVIDSFEDAQTAINVINRRVKGNRADIDILIATLDYHTTPRWRFRARRLAKRYIESLEGENGD